MQHGNDASYVVIDGRAYTTDRGELVSVAMPTDGDAPDLANAEPVIGTGLVANPARATHATLAVDQIRGLLPDAVTTPEPAPWEGEQDEPGDADDESGDEGSDDVPF